MISLTIDGKQVSAAEGISVLEAALQNGIYIPHLCHHPDLPELGACRLCLVECEGMTGPQLSCLLEAADGMVIRTRSAEIDSLRRLSMELILSAHPEDCSTCLKYGQCELQTLIQYMNVSATRMHRHIKNIPKRTHPLFRHEMVRCVLCGRCVRACGDLRGVGVLQLNKADLEFYVGTVHDKLLSEAGCRFCGACAEVCPTGAILDAVSFTAAEKNDTLLPCVAKCPVHLDIPRYLRYVREGRLGDAAAVLYEKLPFPASLGRVCNHKCESACRRGELGEAVSIRGVKRYIADADESAQWKEKTRKSPPTGKSVCVVGGGPAGMTAALYLAKKGHSVTLKEAMPKLGGMLQYGIPSYRLPREIVDMETAYIKEAGVAIEYSSPVSSPESLLPEYDAVLIATGAGSSVKLPIPGSELDGVLPGLDFLKNASTGEETGMGKNVVVLGGGNVAFDCARTAVRLGAETVSVACLESREAMPADLEEIEEAIEEGVAIYPSRSFEAICGETRVTGVRFMTVTSFRFENGRAVLEKESGSEHVLQADTVIFAVGQRPSVGPEWGIEMSGSYIALPEPGSKQTSARGVFACGDVVYGTRSVIEAVAAGREAASEIDRFLGGDGDISETLAPKEQANPKIGPAEDFYGLKRTAGQLIDAKERRSSFAECACGLSEDGAHFEAGRCLQCDLRLQIRPARLWTDYEGKEASGC